MGNLDFCLKIFLIIIVTLDKSWATKNESHNKTTIDTRIIGGEDANWSNSKHIVSIRLREIDNMMFGLGHICGGTLIAKNLVLTATHCLMNQELEPIQFRQSHELIVVMGTLNLLDAANTEKFNVTAINHENFDVETMENDIAIIILERNIAGTNPNIVPIALSTKTPDPGAICYVHGWGAIEVGGRANPDLQVLKVPMLSRKQCMTEYGDRIKDGMLCAGYMEGKKDACQGDSGGPLICNNKLVGVVSWGESCALPKLPGVYTEVQKFRKWINDNKVDRNTASLKNAKYFASIRLKVLENNFGQGIIAGGALITIEKEFYVITTAHSLYYSSKILVRPEKLSVVFNSVNRFNKTSESMVFDIDKIMIHPKYDHSKKLNDIALLKFNKKYFDKLNTLTALKIAKKLSDSKCVTLGYGVNSQSTSDDDKTVIVGETFLHYTDMSVYSLEECNPKYANVLMDDWMCAGEMEYLQNRNQPDDGGPLVCNGELTGLMIHHSSIAYKGFPSIFVDVTKHSNLLISQSVVDDKENDTSNNSANKLFSFSTQIIMISAIIFKFMNNYK